MNIENKQRIIDNLLENRFNVENFKDFTANILNLQVKNRRPYDSIYKVFREYIETYQEISETTDKDGSKFYVLAVKIKSEKDPVRARIKQREFIANILRERKKRGALVAFFNEDYSHWRISFIKLDYEFTAKGFEEKLTPAKRLSYVVGKGEACKTAKDQFFSLTKLEDEVSLNELEEIFALEKVTNDFFKEYKNKYLDIKELLTKDDVFMAEAKKHDIENPESFAEGFAKKLMGQLAFLYFLQKKGWLGVKIVPETLNQQEFNRIYNRALDPEREVLEKAYNKVSSDSYELRKDELNEIISKEEIDLIATPFRNTEYFGEWGTGDKKFIRNLFELHKSNDKDNNKNFFDDYLEILFYNNLSKERGEVQYSLDFNCRIPFLNGGLFDPYGDYNWQTTSFNLSDDIFSNKNKTGILDIFDIYNFTINENDSYETEVAVDPEMLGKVFENLLEVSDRKSKGAFYTPREIVRYMTNESIMNYLLTNLEGKDISKEDLDYLFNFGEFTKEYDQQIFEKDYIKDGKPLTRDIFGMPRNIITNSILIDDLLAKVKIADPACGSGAFPLGILNEIVRARNILTFYINMIEVLKEKDEQNYWKRIDKKQRLRKLYTLKLYTIQNCLHGVDIEPSAIDITKLRLWLSILVDSDNDNVKPLPNLDFNFMIGNSLVDEFEGMKLFDESLLNLDEFSEGGSLEQKRLIKQHRLIQDTLFKTSEERKQDILKDIFRKQAEYFSEKNADKKRELKSKIESLENRLIEVTLLANGNEKKLEEIKKGRKERRKPYFLWKLEFAKVFKENGGFDIVIGNPPYIGFHKVPNKELNKKLFYSAQGKYDFYILFIEKAYYLLKEKGILSYICPSYFYKRNYGEKLREFILNNMKIKLIIDFEDNQIFETAQTYTCIFLFEKNKNNDFNKIKVGETIKNKEFTLIEQSKLTEPQWIIKSSNANLILEKLKNKFPLKLSDITTSISQGIVTGDNSVFLIDFQTIKSQNINMNFLKKAYKGKDIGKEISEEESYYLFYPYEVGEKEKNILIPEEIIKEKNINLYKYLLEKKDKLVSRGYFVKSNKSWYELWNPRKAKHFYNRKFVFPEINNKNNFYIVDEYFYTDSACGFELKKEYIKYEKIIKKYLNSEIATYFFKRISVPKANGYFIYKNSFLKDFPIPFTFDEEEIEKFESLKNEIEIFEFISQKIELTQEEKEKIKAEIKI